MVRTATEGDGCGTCWAACSLRKRTTAAVATTKANELDACLCMRFPSAFVRTDRFIAANLGHGRRSVNTVPVIARACPGQSGTRRCFPSARFGATRTVVGAGSSGPGLGCRRRSIVMKNGLVFLIPIGLLAAVVRLPGQEVPSESVTFTKDIAPILQRSCQKCHRPG